MISRVLCGDRGGSDYGNNKMTNQQTEAFLSEHLLPIENQKNYVPKYLFNPLHIGVFVFGVLGQYFGLIQREMRYLPVEIDLTFYLLRISGYFVFMYFLLPYVWRWCAVKRVPLVLNQFMVYSSYMGLYFLIFGPIVSNFTFVPTYMRFLNNVVIGIPFVILISYVFGRRISISLFDNPEMYPVFRRYKLPKTILHAKLAPEKVSPIQYMEAQTPYVYVVTEAGNETLRMSFREALAMVPDSDGWQIHRSYWVAKDQVAGLRFINGNPRVYLNDGRELPATRSVVPKIKSYLQANQSLSGNEPSGMGEVAS